MNENQKIHNTIGALTDCLTRIKLLKINREKAILNNQSGMTAMIDREIKYYQSKIHKISNLI